MKTAEEYANEFDLKTREISTSTLIELEKAFKQAMKDTRAAALEEALQILREEEHIRASQAMSLHVREDEARRFHRGQETALRHAREAVALLRQP